MSEKMRCYSCLLVFTFLTPLAGATEVYKWTDEDGVVNYGERPPANVAAEKVRLSGVAPSPSVSTDKNSSQQIRNFLKSRDARAEQNRKQRQKAQQRRSQQQKSDADLSSDVAKGERKDKKQKSRQLKTLAEQLNEFNQSKPDNSAPGNSGQNRKKISQKLKQKNIGEKNENNNDS